MQTGGSQNCSDAGGGVEAFCRVLLPWCEIERHRQAMGLCRYFGMVPRMRLGLRSLALAMALLPAPTVHARDVNGLSRIRGIGGDSCVQFLDDRRSPPLVKPYESWLEGFLTALNSQLSNTYDIAGETDTDDILEWIAQWCGDNPGSKFLQGAQAYVIFAYPSRIRSK